MKKILTLIVLTVFFFTCSETVKEETAIVEESPCRNAKEFHFSGYINDDVKCFNDGIQDYQRYSGGEVEGHEAPIGRFVMGMDTWPVNNGDEALFIYTPKANTKDVEDIKAKLPLGELSLEQRQEFLLRYRVVLDVADIHNMKTHQLNAKFDNDSSINIYKIEELHNYLFYTGTILKVSMLISCNLYDRDNNLAGEIRSGDFTGLIYVDDAKDD
ncbi:hypothetical protein [Seonamhaeicola maritimus]|uniref:Uncharacterized protein n=1 Tax=Seonamhaeicola maritimus TaxID=2591822 RepID=A0A5C7GG46_9FLAO|nr:hypothetical protein [Seonamhaeicola maritimus]TXG35621.1 hypothetical protein FUA22_14035 [Seonamhaeicola maritimus]